MLTQIEHINNRIYGVDPENYNITTLFDKRIMYAVIESGGKQYRVAPGDTLEIERLAVEAGQPVTFDRVLLVNNDGKVAVGSPTVASATVLASFAVFSSTAWYFTNSSHCSLLR